MTPELWNELERVTRALFHAARMAAAQGLILVDTKYEFGLRNGVLTLIDEIHTPTALATSTPMATKPGKRRRASETTQQGICRSG